MPTSTRTFWPLGLFFWGQSWTLGAWCEPRGEYRSCRPDRMAGLTLPDDTFDRENGRLLGKFIRIASGDI